MTLKELQQAHLAAHNRFGEEAAAFNPAAPNADAEMERISGLACAASMARQTFEIARDYTIDAAMLFKLSDGAIDPRHP